MAQATRWEVHLYAPAETMPASRESFGSFDAAFAYATELKRDRPNGWHVHVQPPAHATAAEIAQLQENALFPS